MKKMHKTKGDDITAVLKRHRPSFLECISIAKRISDSERDDAFEDICTVLDHLISEGVEVTTIVMECLHMESAIFSKQVLYWLDIQQHASGALQAEVEEHAHLTPAQCVVSYVKSGLKEEGVSREMAERFMNGVLR